MIKAKCHCGNITVQVDKLTGIFTECNCSICRRLACKWMYFKEHQVTVSYKNRQSKGYEWGDKDIAFHHCPICGCATHYVGTDNSSLDRIAINVNMLKPKLIENLKIRRFNGAEM